MKLTPPATTPAHPAAGPGPAGGAGPGGGAGGGRRHGDGDRVAGRVPAAGAVEQAGGHRDAVAAAQALQRRPPGRCAQRVARGCAQAAARAGDQAQDRLNALVEEGAGADRAQAPVPVQGVDEQVLPGLPAPDQLADGQPPAAGRLGHQRLPGQALAHRRPGRDDDEVGVLQPRGQAVQLGEAGGDPGQLAVVVVQPFDRLEGVGEHVAQALVVRAEAALGDLVDQGLGDVHGPLDVLWGLEAELDDAGAHVDQPPEGAGLLDDARVVAGVRGGRHARHQREQERRAADVGEHAAAAQVLGDGDRVDRVAARVQLQDRVEHRPVRRAVEVLAVQQLEDLGDRVLGQQHRAEDRLLGLDVVGRDPLVRRRLVARRALVGKTADGHCPRPPRRRRAS
jgi:hypothetical protein